MKTVKEGSKVIHPIPPVFDSSSRVLILGSFPSVKSREAMFFYGHPQNRFWKVLAAVLTEPVPESIAQKRDMLIRNHIAVWDVIHSCTITGSSDQSIRDVKVNDLRSILTAADIKAIYVNGQTAGKMYKKYILPELGRQCIVLPSTSPANAAWTVERLTDEWKQIRDNL